MMDYGLFINVKVSQRSRHNMDRQWMLALGLLLCLVVSSTAEILKVTITTPAYRTLTCTPDVISVVSAYFGKEGVCESTTALATFTAQCEGEETCDVRKLQFDRCGDPEQLGRHLTLILEYECVPAPTTTNSPTTTATTTTLTTTPSPATSASTSTTMFTTKQTSPTTTTTILAETTTISLTTTSIPSSPETTSSQPSTTTLTTSSTTEEEDPDQDNSTSKDSTWTEHVPATSPVVDLTNDCIGVVCKHGGTCIDDFDSFVCKCTEPFTGTVCEDKEIANGCERPALISWLLLLLLMAISFHL